MVLTNRLKKYIRSLSLHKYRQKYNNFIAEGPKTALEFINAEKYGIETIVCTEEWYKDNRSSHDLKEDKLIICDAKELQSVTQLKNSNNILIVLSNSLVENPDISQADKVIYLDGIQDPGNMGTVIRIADWYGVDAVCASKDSVDFYNPKVIQAAMGSHNRVGLYNYSVDDTVFDAFKSIALTLEGEDINEFETNSDKSMIVLGSEGRGISSEVLARADHKLSIHRKGGAESLNAAVACGIACHCLFG